MVPAARAGAVGRGRAVHGGGGCRGRPPRPRRARLAEGVRRRPFVGWAPRAPRRAGDAGAAPRRSAVDPLGSVGDGRWPEFDEEIFRRTPEAMRARARELDELSMAGEADDELALEGMRLVWPAYFADPERAPPMPELQISSERSGEMVPSIQAELPALEAGLPGIGVPVGFVHGRGARCRSPPRRTRRSGFRAPGSRSSTVPDISSGLKRPALFARRFAALRVPDHLDSPVEPWKRERTCFDLDRVARPTREA